MNNQNQGPIPNSNPTQSPSGSQSSGSQESAPPPAYRNWHEQRRAERWARREARWQRQPGRPYGWIGGAILILLGVTFLLQNMGLPFLTNWWALFILIPAFWAYVAAWDIYQDNSRLTRGGVGSLTVGILLTLLALVFLLNVDVGLFWPVLLIAGGLVLLATAFFPE
jgi:hypothetical protein